MQTLSCAKITPRPHQLFSSAGTGPSSGVRNAEPFATKFPTFSATNFPTFSPLNGHNRRQLLHPYGYGRSLARFSFQKTFKCHQQTDANPVILEDDEENKVAAGKGEFLQITQTQWDFIKKLYGMVATHLFFTGAVSSAVLFSPSISQFLLKNPTVIKSLLTLFCGDLVVLWLLHKYKNEYRHNFHFLFFFTLILSLKLGPFTDGKIVLEALATTTAFVTSLTAYTFWDVMMGKDFSYLISIAFANLFAMATIGLINFFATQFLALNPWPTIYLVLWFSLVTWYLH